MGLPSSDSVTKTFPTTIHVASSLSLAECITNCTPLSLLQCLSPGLPIQTDTKTLVSPSKSIGPSPTSGSCSPALLFPWGSTNVHKAIPYGETTLAQVNGSIGNTFIQSLDDRMRRADKVMRGRQEMMFWDTQEVSTLTNAFRGPNPTRFNVDLISHSMQLMINSVWNEVQIELSQLVWKYIYQSTLNGWTVTYNPQGPFVVIACSGHCYTLVDTRGFLHPTVEAHCLVPAYTSWHAMRLPQDLAWHPDITNILDTWKDKLEGLLRVAWHSRWCTASSNFIKSIHMHPQWYQEYLVDVVRQQVSEIADYQPRHVKHHWVSPFIEVLHFYWFFDFTLEMSWYISPFTYLSIWPIPISYYLQKLVAMRKITSHRFASSLSVHREYLSFSLHCPASRIFV